MRTHPSRLLAAVLLPFFALAGCAANPVASSDPTPAQSPESSQSAPVESPQSIPPTPSPSASVADSEEWMVGGQEVAPGSSTVPPFVNDFRVGRHEGFDRVVVEFTGDAELGWLTRWTDAPVEQGRGQALEVTGPAFLDVSIRGTSFPQTDDDNKRLYSGDTLLTSGDIRAIYDSAFEDQTHIVIGMDQQRPYRIYTETSPLRLVIDVKNS